MSGVGAGRVSEVSGHGVYPPGSVCMYIRRTVVCKRQAGRGSGRCRSEHGSLRRPDVAGEGGMHSDEGSRSFILD